jgi:hypothetical protein
VLIDSFPSSSCLTTATPGDTGNCTAMTKLLNTVQTKQGLKPPGGRAVLQTQGRYELPQTKLPCTGQGRTELLPQTKLLHRAMWV